MRCRSGTLPNRLGFVFQPKRGTRSAATDGIPTKTGILVPHPVLLKDRNPESYEPFEICPRVRSSRRHRRLTLNSQSLPSTGLSLIDSQ